VGETPTENRTPRLLIMRASMRKRPDAAEMPALERYDGPRFQVLRKYLRSMPGDPPLVRVVSSEHGLMTLDQPIAEYDRRMTRERALELQPTVLADLAALVQAQPVREVLVVIDKQYLLALIGFEQVLDGIPVSIAGETQGRKLATLRSWLYGEEAARTNREVRKQSPTNPRQPTVVRSVAMTFRVGGKRFTTSAGEALSVARHAITEGEKAATRITRWYVPVDGGRIGPKWLVSKVSGVPRNDFQASAARSILERLGIVVTETTGAS
jgi:hypothetical protein